MSDSEDSDVSDSPAGESPRLDEAKTHAKQLQGLKDSQAEFYSYLQEFDKDLLDFDEDDSDEEAGADLDSDGEDRRAEKAQKPAAKVITTEMVDSWCGAVRENRSLGAIRSLLRAFRAACHCGDDGENDSTKLNIVSSSVFNKVMVFVLNDMDGILRGLLRAPSHGGKKETVMELMTTKAGKKYGSLMKLYLGNGLHILNQMTDEQMISFTLKRIKASAVFLAAFPTLLRKYIKVALHAWGTGRGSLPVVAFLFLRDLCVKVGGDCIDSCLRGVYKAFAMNCKLAKSVSRSKLGHINFLGNCVTELYGVDLSSAYQQAFLFIRQLAVILHGALTERGTKVVKDKKKGKQQKQSNKSEKSYQKVYDWQYISCLELWTAVVCTYKSESDFRPLAYPLTQLIHGVACLVPTARYFPLRLRCVRMLNRIAGATGTFIPVASLLLDMLEMKELNSPPTGGIGKAVDLIGIKQVDKTTLKTRAFQQACVYSIVEELAEHLSQWSYSVAFFELSFIPLVRLRNFCKSTKVDRFRREIRELIRQVEANSEFTNSRRTSIKFTPNEQAPESFMKVEKETGSSPLSQFVADLRLRAKERNDSMTESSVVVGEKGSKFHREDDDDDEEEDDEDDGGGADVFNSSWLPAKKSKDKDEPKTPKKRRHEEEHDGGGLEDIVEDLVLSSDDEVDEDEDDEGNELLTNSVSSENGKEGSKYRSSKHRNKKQKPMPSANTEEKVQKLAASASPPKKARRQRWKKKVRKGSSG